LGTPYPIRFKDGHIEGSATFLHERLAAYGARGQQPALIDLARRGPR
jgi:hypothetical protein